MTITIDIAVVIYILFAILFASAIIMKLYFFAKVGMHDWFSKLYVGSILVSAFGFAVAVRGLVVYLLTK